MEQYTLREQLDNEIGNVLKPSELINNYGRFLAREFTMFKSTHKLTPNLTILNNALKSIRRTSTETVRVFSTPSCK